MPILTGLMASVLRIYAILTMPLCVAEAYRMKTGHLPLNTTLTVPPNSFEVTQAVCLSEPPYLSLPHAPGTVRYLTETFHLQKNNLYHQ
jgi:hypothetical protein